MRRIAVAIVAWLALACPSIAAESDLYCYNPTGTGLQLFVPCSSTTPLQVSATITPSGVQNVNLTQILSAAPSASNPLWVLFGSGATLPAFAAPPTVILGAGTAKVGIVTTDQTTPGTTDLVHAAQQGTWTVTSNQGTANATPWNENVTQFGGSNIATGTGASGAGIPRVTISNDSSLAANQSVNHAQVAGTSTSVNNGAADNGTQRVALAPNGNTSTMATGAPTTPTFSSILAASSTRKGCLVQNTGTTTGYIYFGATGSATTSNSFQLSAGQSISCQSGNITLTDNIAATCASGTCAFVISSQ